MRPRLSFAWWRIYVGGRMRELRAAVAHREDQARAVLALATIETPDDPRWPDVHAAENTEAVRREEVRAWRERSELLTRRRELDAALREAARNLRLYLEYNGLRDVVDAPKDGAP